MIVLDANVLIAFLDARDAHHSLARLVLEEYASEGYAASALTVAEALVHPAKQGLQDRGSAALSDIGLKILPLSGEDATSLARVRARYRVRMPDAVALHAALTIRSPIATFDAGLAAAAREAGVTVVDGLSDAYDPGRDADADLRAVDAALGAWDVRDVDGTAYVERLRSGGRSTHHRGSGSGSS